MGIHRRSLVCLCVQPQACMLGSGCQLRGNPFPFSREGTSYPAAMTELISAGVHGAWRRNSPSSTWPVQQNFLQKAAKP